MNTYLMGMKNFNSINNQKGFLSIVLGVLILLVVSGGAYYLGTQKNNPTNNSISTNPPASLKNEQEPRATTYASPTEAANTTIDSRKEQVIKAGQKNQQNQCYNAIYETTRSICKTKIGYDPGPADGSGVREWNTLTEEEKTKEALFWQCYDQISLDETQKCSSKYQNVTNQRSAYYDCLAKGVDVGKYCGDTTGYNQTNNFPKDKERQYWQCMETTRKEKENKCANETGYNPN